LLLPKIADPATKVSAPAVAAAAIFSTLMPPSTSTRIGRPLAATRRRTSAIFGSVLSMNCCPPKPGLTDISSTRSSLPSV
jgi:hypothetical protein